MTNAKQRSSDPVLIVGAGPVGLILAFMLVQLKSQFPIKIFLTRPSPEDSFLSLGRPHPSPRHCHRSSRYPSRRTKSACDNFPLFRNLPAIWPGPSSTSREGNSEGGCQVDSICDEFERGRDRGVTIFPSRAGCVGDNARSELFEDET